jgi:hypothetical protein
MDFSKEPGFCAVLEPLFLPLDGCEAQQSLPASLLCCGQCTSPILYQAKENFPTAKGVNMVNSTEGGQSHTWANGTNSMVDRNLGEIPLPVSMTVNIIILLSSSALSRFSSWSLILIVP